MWVPLKIRPGYAYQRLLSYNEYLLGFVKINEHACRGAVPRHSV